MSAVRIACVCFIVASLACDGIETGEQPGAVVVADGGIPRRSSWSYWDRGGDLGTAWRARTFDDAAWARGPGPLGYGETYLGTTVGYGASATNKHITTYFRTQFTVSDPAAVRAITGALLYDDGLVVYLNGQEIERRGVPSPSTAATLAAGHEASSTTYEPADWSARIPLLVAGVNTIAVEVHQQAASSSDLVFDLGLTLEVAAPPPPPPSGGLPRRSVWSYWDRGPAGFDDYAWRFPGHDDSTWATGAGPLGYGESYLATTVGYGPSSTSKHITTYFRADLTLSHVERVVGLTAELMYDDGAVIYLNGHEIARRAMPAATTPTTLATGHEANNTYEAIDVTWARTYLQEGVNTIAVEVKQLTAGSSDLVFDLALLVDTGPPVYPEDIARGGVWSYWDRGGLGGTTWRAASFDDRAWSSGDGPLGYGETYHNTTVSYGASASNKLITTYFRKRFTVADPAAVTSIAGEIIYDDGAVIYLNGNEVTRLHMPAGTISSSTLAQPFETGYRYETYDWSAARSFLVAGTNVLAVEVHQSSPSSSDLTFDLSLALSSSCATPPTGTWTGTTLDRHQGSGAGEEERADVTWTLARTDGCVDHYTPSGTAHHEVGAHYCWDYDPESAPIEPGDGWLVIDRSVSPASYAMHGRSTWSAIDTCAEPPGPVTLSSNWASHLHGTISGDVMSGGWGDYGHSIEWHLTRANASFPPPSGCYEPATDRWLSETSEYHPWNGGVRARVTWRRISTIGCVDEFEPESGIATFLAGDSGSPHSYCRTVTASPESGPVLPGDGTLRIDRATNPPTFDVRGSSGWAGETTCTRQDGTTESIGAPGGGWAEGRGAYQTVPFEGGLGADSDYQSDWSLER